MLSGTVLFADGGRMNGAAVERILTVRNPKVHVERTVTGMHALAIQSVMRPEIVILGMDQQDMTGEHLICELKRDVAKPFIIACIKEGSASRRGEILKLGANAVMEVPLPAEKAEELIEEQLKKRNGKDYMTLHRVSLQRVFADAGVPFELKGYRYLEYALMLLESGEARLEDMGALYEKIGEKYGSTPSAVEHNIRYAVGLCASRTGATGKMKNREFLSGILMQQKTGTQRINAPRVSVFCAERRVFR